MTKQDLRSPLQAIASLWLAAVILLLLMVSMACATVHEMRHGVEPTKELFYGSWWFIGLLTLFGINAVAALIMRWPFSGSEMGFAMTHVALVLIFLGAWVTRLWGIEGQIGLVDGQSTTHFSVGGDSLVIESEGGEAWRQVEFNAQRLESDQPSIPLGDARLVVEAYAADSRSTSDVIEDLQRGAPAVELVLGMGGQQSPQWVFADDHGPAAQSIVSYRVIPDRAQLEELLQPAATTQTSSTGTVRVTDGEQVFEFTLEKCLEEAVALGETGNRIHVLRYLPHATVGQGMRVQNLSDQPMNPAIQFEIAVPDDEPVMGWAFARMPHLDLAQMHGRRTAGDMKVTLIMSGAAVPTTPIEVLALPGGPMHARFLDEQGQVHTAPLTLGEPVATPFDDVSLTVRQRLEHALMRETIDPVDPPSESPTPAIRVMLTEADGQSTPVWIQKYTTRNLTLGGQVNSLTYADKRLPLNCRIKLDKFTIRRYPGMMMPRSFESRVTFLDSATGREQERLISMNHPAKHGRYTFFQSSYKERENGTPITYLSVAHDPGQTIVFGAYLMAIVGMLWEVVTRLVVRRSRVENGADAAMPKREDADE